MTTPEPFNTAHIIQLRRRAAWVLWAEFWLRAVLPGGALILAYVTVALFGFGSAVLLGLVAAAAVLSFGVALWRLTPLTASAIDRRIETASGLAHRPFSMLDDAPETEGHVTAALWAAHQRRLADTLRQAKTGHVSLQLARHDPLSLRLLLLLLLLVGVVMAGPSAPTRLAAAFELPAWPFAAPVINAWITPPDYTNISPEPLTPDKNANALSGSKLTLIINSSDTTPSAWLDGHRLKFTRLTDNSYRTDALLAASGRLVLVFRRSDYDSLIEGVG